MAELPRGRVNFPQSKEDFADDARVSYDSIKKRFMIEADGAEYEWHDDIQKWVELVCPYPHLGPEVHLQRLLP